MHIIIVTELYGVVVMQCFTAVKWGALLDVGV